MSAFTHLSIVDVHVAAEKERLHRLALHRRDLLLVLQVLRVHRARSDMVGKHILELLDVHWVEEVIEESLGQLGEGFVRGREDSERTGAGQSVDELAGLEGGDEGWRGRGWRRRGRRSRRWSG